MLLHTMGTVSECASASAWGIETVWRESKDPKALIKLCQFYREHFRGH